MVKNVLYIYIYILLREIDPVTERYLVNRVPERETSDDLEKLDLQFTYCETLGCRIELLITSVHCVRDCIHFRVLKRPV